jgi:hypothetical protein
MHPSGRPIRRLNIDTLRNDEDFWESYTNDKVKKDYIQLVESNRHFIHNFMNGLANINISDGTSYTYMNKIR